MEFTRGLLAEGRRIVPFERDGEKPLLTAARNAEERDRQVAALIGKLREEGVETIAVITKTAAGKPPGL